MKDNKTIHKPKIWTKIGLTSDLDYFIENLSMLVGSGMNISLAIGSIGKELRSSKMRSISKWIQEEISAGSSLAHTLEQTKLFSDHVVSLIKIGEESGKLSQNLALVSEQQKKDRMFRSKLTSALLYPAFVLSLTLIVSIGIAWFILPKLALVFDQLRIELPVLTQILIATGEYLEESGITAVPIFLFLIALIFYFVFLFPKTKHIGQSILFHLPGTGELIKQVELARFSYLLGTLLDAGLPVTRALRSLGEATTFSKYKNFYTYLEASIADGNSFKKSFAFYRKLKHIIPAPVEQLIVAGEQSGNLSASLGKIHETYEAKIETTTKNLAVILEPILLVIVWLGVVSVALAIILPIYSLIGGLNRGPQVAPNVSVQETEGQEIIFEEPELEDPAEEAVLAELNEAVPAESLLNLEILSTGLGYLNVRDEPSLDGQITGRVLPGETYQYIEESNGWYRIILSDDTEGWVFGQYVRINETQ
ncbi:MAG TPA: type II secretion system F family protein [Candidatus Paceibacterota bacterium]|nr:type II secretion system F family protein [Candidatus Paceibacterota bacterium]